MNNKPVIGAAVALLVVVAGTWYYLHSRHAGLSRAPETAQTHPPAEPQADGAIQHPLPGGEAPASAPLPSLADSDAALRDALGQVVGLAAAKDYLLPENIIRHLVVTIDNLPRQKVAVQNRPTSAVGGTFAADGDELHATLDAQNFARYQPMVTVIAKLDMRRVPAVYIRCFSKRIKTWGIRTATSTTGWCRSSTACWRRRSPQDPSRWSGRTSCMSLPIRLSSRVLPGRNC